MTKKDLIDQVTSSSGVSLSKKDTETLLEATFNAIGQAVCKEKRFAYPGFRHLHIARTNGTERTQSANRGHHEDQSQQDYRLQADAFPQRQPVIIATNTGARGPARPARRHVPLVQREHPHDSARLEAPAGYLRGNKGSAKKCGCDLKVASHV